jgi:hypothetical protein
MNMAVIVNTPKPKALLAAIRKNIDEKHIATWAYDEDGDFAHTAEQWLGQAWLRPSTQSGLFLLGLVGKEDTPMTKTVYGVYHGRFIEMLLTHFDGDFSSASATAQEESGVDIFK